MGTRDTYQRVLVQACLIAGDETGLAKKLRVPVHAIVAWLLGEAGCPTSVFLRAVDVVLEGTRRKLEVTRRQLDIVRDEIQTTRALLDGVRRRHRQAEEREKAGTMDPNRFEARLRAEGYPEIRTNRLEPHRHNAAHSHPFDVLALVLEGDITLTVEGAARTYRPGDEFAMKAGCTHVEDSGPQGVKYLVGRRPIG